MAAATACAPTLLIPDSDRQQVAHELEGQSRYLRSSVHVLPFFSDPSRRLLSAQPPDSIELINDTEGRPILPGEPTGLLPLGTRVRIEKVEFPTSLVVTRRPVYSPRTQPWVYLSVAGQSEGPPYVIVLRQGIRSREEFMGLLDHLLVLEDPRLFLESQPVAVREAIREKRLLPGMSAEAVGLAWGQPEKIRAELRDGVRVETWSWPLGKREAVIKDGKLESARPPLAETVP